MAKKTDVSSIDEYQLELLKVDDVEYKTLLTKKYMERVKYQPDNPKLITAFIPGTIADVFVKKGKKIEYNDKLIALEAMKMVNEVRSPMDGTIKKVYVKKGDIVSKNQLLIELE